MNKKQRLGHQVNNSAYIKNSRIKMENFKYKMRKETAESIIAAYGNNGIRLLFENINGVSYFSIWEYNGQLISAGIKNMFSADDQVMLDCDSDKIKGWLENLGVQL